MLMALVLAARPSNGATDVVQGHWTGNYGAGLRLNGTVPSQSINGAAGFLREMALEGTSGTSWAYCIKLLLHLEQNDTLDASAWTAANVPNLPNIQRILMQHPAEATMTNFNAGGASRDQANAEAAAVQGAIWHFSDGFNLTNAHTDSGTDRTSDVKPLYDQIVADASAHPATEPAPTTLTVTPDTATAVAGNEAGPFTITTTAATVTLAVSDTSTEIRDCTTHAAKTTAVSGDKVCLFRASQGGPVTLTATGQADVDAGRVFISAAHPTTSQDIIMAGTKTVTVSAAVQGTWTAAPTTTTTAPTTTTTVPRTTTTTVPATTTTTVGVSVLAEQPQQAAGVPVQPAAATPVSPAAALPFTGTKALTAAAIAFALLSIGTFVVGMTLPSREAVRRKR